MTPDHGPWIPSSRWSIVLLTAALVTGLGGFVTAAGPGLVEEETAADGHWLEPFEGEVPAIHMSLRPDGTVAYYGGNHPHETTDDFNWTYFTATMQRSNSRVMDLGERSPVVPANEPGPDLFCSDPITAPDGSTVTVGGSEWIPSNESADGPVLGHEESYAVGLGDGVGGEAEGATWERLPDMNNRRWYPTGLTLSDGSLAVFSGIRNLTNPTTNVVAIDVLEPGADAWENVEPDLRLADGVTLENQGRQGDADGAPVNLPMYPRLFVVSGGPLKGDVFYPSDGDLWGEFGERGAEEPLWGMYQSYDRSEETWTVHGPSAFGARHLGATVPLMLDPAGPDGEAGTGDDYAPTLLTFGGTLQRSTVATATAETVTLDDGTPTPEVVEPMEQARWQPQGELLPTGQVLAVGGTELDTTVLHGQKVPHPLTAELFDPATGTWETLAEMDVPRGYHSTSVVTPNATVLTAGHVPNPNPWPQFRNNNFAEATPTHHDEHTILNQTHHSETRFEEFVPPYLEQEGETRPEIASAVTPAQGSVADPGEHPSDLHVDHGEDFTVTVEGVEEGVEDVVLLRTGAATHGLHADQRGVRLAYDVVQDDGGTKTLALEAPPDGDVAPPGHYMLFVNEDSGDHGYPSEAAFVGLGVDDLGSAT